MTPALQLIESLIQENALLSSIEEEKNSAVSVSKWINSEYYAGALAVDIYPYWKERLVEFYDGGYNEAVVTGAMGCGKSVFADLVFLRKAYELSCNQPIARNLGLADSSIIIFLYLSLSLFQAGMTGYGKMVKMIDGMPYFKERFPRNKEKDSVIEFADKQLIIVPGSDISHIKGGDLLGLIFDESNFRMGTSDKSKYERAARIYIETLNRRETRFMTGKDDPSISVIVSSTDSKTSFTEHQIERAKKDPRTLIISATTWDTKPARYSGDKFWVFTGSEDMDAFLEGDEQALKNYCVNNGMEPQRVEFMSPERKSEFMAVPIEHKRPFEIDIVQALADLGGVSKGVTSKFFYDANSYRFCFNEKRGFGHPFTKDELMISFRGHSEVKDYLRPDWPGFKKGRSYFAHIDQSLSTDCTGLAIAHADFDNQGLIVEVDMMLRIRPPIKPDQISIKKVREFMLWCRKEKNLNLKYVSYDSFQSAETLQEFEMAGVEAGLQSVDRDSTQYDLMASLIRQKRMVGYHYKPFHEELFDLEKDNERKKVDHPPASSKDVADGVAGAVFLAYTKGSARPLQIRVLG